MGASISFFWLHFQSDFGLYLGVFPFLHLLYFSDDITLKKIDTGNLDCTSKSKQRKWGIGIGFQKNCTNTNE